MDTVNQLLNYALNTPNNINPQIFKMIAENLGKRISVIDTSNLLPDDASNGDVSIVLNTESGFVPIEYPQQQGSSSVDVDIASKDFLIGIPNYSESGLDIILESHTALPTLSIEFENNMEYAGKIFPIVSDLSNNKFVDAGITINENETIVGQSGKDYAIYLSFTEEGIDAINPEKIVQVDETHITVPAMGIYVFEPVTGTIANTVTANFNGWNIVQTTLDTTSYEVTNMSVETNVENINDYLKIVSSAENSMTLEGDGATYIFNNIIGENEDIINGLYIKLEEGWTSIHSLEPDDYVDLFE